jgi:hypothetical protein
MAQSPMSRARIRHHAARRCGFRALSNRQLTDLNEEIDNALAMMSADCIEAFAFNPAEVDVMQLYRLDNYSAGVKAVAGLPAIIQNRMLEITDADGTPLSHATWTPAVDGTWDGRMWLRITTGGNTYLLQSREWFKDPGVGQAPPVPRYYVSLVEPLPFATTDAITDVQIFQRHLWFPGDTTYVKAMGADSSSFFNAITEIDPATARYRMASLRDEITAGDVHNIWRDTQFNMPEPLEAPTVTITQAAWDPSANFPKGTFEFCFTYVWGRVGNLASGNSPRGIFQPLWESAPSPLTSFTMSIGTLALSIQTTNVDAQLGFSHSTLSGTLWDGKSGLRIRIYVRVKSLVASTGDARYKKIETSDKFLLLQEIEPTALVGSDYASYLWDGTAIPDYETILKPVPGYFGYGMYPQPLTDRALDFTIRRMPLQLQDDFMVVHMHPDGREALIQLIMYAIMQADGRTGDAQIAKGEYLRLVDGLRARYGNPGAFGLPRGMGDDYVLTTEPITVFAT